MGANEATVDTQPIDDATLRVGRTTTSTNPAAPPRSGCATRRLV